MNNPLLDKNFLKELDNFRSHEIYARITALSVKELPIEYIEGKVTGGSINIDGTSAVRRTCNLSMVAQNVNINEFYWGLHNKFKLEIGLKNNINLNYPDIIWFPQGVYVITSFNTALSTSGFNISISGKDKMCLLNGEVGGQLPASIDFGVEEYVDLENEITTYTKVPIKKIIKEAVHAYALEPYYNIIINDLEDSGLELLEYRGEDPLYLLYDITREEYSQMYMDGSTECYLIDTKKWSTLAKIKNYNKRIDNLVDDNPTRIKLINTEDATIYTVAKVEYGQTAGYRLTDLVYAGDLISNIGESLTSILDKIVKMLGNFEYFYDLDGRFIFQEKKTYVQTSWNTITTIEEDTYVDNSMFNDYNIYHFEGNNLISSFSNSPNLNNVRNDYSVWGTRKTVNDVEVPVHYRYAIHKKPEYYKNIAGEEFSNKDWDWREIIYQMALDYYQYNELGVEVPVGDNKKYVPLELKIKENNPDHYPTGMTGYEAFYLDLQGFWRQLYNPNPPKKYYNYLYDTTPSEMKLIPDWHKLPDCLKDGFEHEWWEFEDWAEKYKLVYGVYPGNNPDYPDDSTENSIGKYCTNTCLLDLNVYFPEGKKWDKDRRLFLFEVAADGTLYDVSHNPPIHSNLTPEQSCINHGYKYFKNQIDKGIKVYIYDPLIPTTATEVEETFQPIDSDGEPIKELFIKEKYVQLSADSNIKDRKDVYIVKTINGKPEFQRLIDALEVKYKFYVIEKQLYLKDNKFYFSAAFAPSSQALFKDDMTKIDEDKKNYYLELNEIIYVKDKEGNKTYYKCNGKDSKGYATFVEDASIKEILVSDTYYITADSEKYESGYKAITYEIADRIEKKEIYIKDGENYISLLDSYPLNKNCYLKQETEEYISINSDDVPDGVKSLYYNNGVYNKYYTTTQLDMAGQPVPNTVPIYNYLTYYVQYYDYFTKEETDSRIWNWKKEVKNSPDSLNFWLDFLDSSELFYDKKGNSYTVGCELDDYAIPAIGDRTKVVNDSNVKSIYFRDVPNLIFTTYEQLNAIDLKEKTGYIFFFIKDASEDPNGTVQFNYFNISAQGKSAKEKLDELLYYHSYCTESINISAIPIYYLEPNTRISVRDDNSKINGEYLVSRISIPLTYNGMMSITATKAPQRLY